MAKGRLRSPGVDAGSARASVAAVWSMGTSFHEVREHAARSAMSLVCFAPGSGNRVLQCGARLPRPVHRAVIQSALRSEFKPCPNTI